MIAIAESPKKARRPASKSIGRPVEPRKKIGVYLSLDAYRRLNVTATMDGVDLSTIVDDLVKAHLRRYVIQDRQKETVPAALSLPDEVSAAVPEPE